MHTLQPSCHSDTYCISLFSRVIETYHHRPYHFVMQPCASIYKPYLPLPDIIHRECRCKRTQEQDSLRSDDTHLLDRSLMIGWIENSWNPERVSYVLNFVCVCVCVSVCLCVCLCVCVYAGYRAHLLTYEPNFWVKWSLGHEKKRIFLFFKIFIFTLVIGIFRFFPYITLVNFCFQATGHSFSCRNMIFG